MELIHFFTPFLQANLNEPRLEKHSNIRWNRGSLAAEAYVWCSEIEDILANRQLTKWEQINSTQH